MADRELFHPYSFRKQSQPFDVEGLQAAIEYGYNEEMRGSVTRKLETYSPSRLSYGDGTCPRRWAMGFSEELTYEDTFDHVGSAQVEVGSTSHERLQRILEKSGVLLDKEVEVKSDDPPVRGFVDAILDYKGTKIVCEIKTTRQEAFVYREATLTGAPYHMYQLLLYMWILKIDTGVLLYENRNDNNLLVIPVEMNAENTEALNEALEWMRNVYRLSKEGANIKRPFQKRNKICKACPILDECYARPNGTIEVAPMVVRKL